MRKTAGVLAVVLWLGTGAAAVWADTHVFTSTSRLYMDQERKTEDEIWIAPGRSWMKSRGRIIVSREDLGVMWFIEPGGTTYREFSMKEFESAAKNAKPDMRKLWLDYYLPEFEWTFKETGETKDFNGFPCRRFEARGEADFSDIQGVYWICETPGIPGGRELRDYILGQIKGDRQRAGQAKIMIDRPDAIVVLREETIEHSIAPTSVQKWNLVKLEEGPAPAGIYDLPAGLKKIENRG